LKNTCEFIKNDNILENKKLLLKDIQYFFAIEIIPICQQKWKVFGNPVSFITQSIEYFSGIYKYFTILIPDIFHRFKPTFGEIGQK
jgi:hypothetical protein